MLSVPPACQRQRGGIAPHWLAPALDVAPDKGQGWPRGSGQRGVLTCCGASGRPLTTVSRHHPRPWLSSFDERADGGLGHVRAGSALLRPGGAMPQHSGAVAASQPPMDPKPPSGRPPRAQGWRRVLMLLGALLLSLTRCCGALTAGDGARQCRRVAVGTGRAPPRPGSWLRTPQRAQDGALPPLDPHRRSHLGAGPAGPPPRPSPRPREPAVPRALSPQRPGQQMQGGDAAGPNSTCRPGRNALSADGAGRGHDKTGRGAAPTIY